MYTVNVERFAVLNICGFSVLKFLAGILSQCLGQQCSLFNYSYVSIHRKIFTVLLDRNHENHEGLAQQTFPRLQYN